MKRAFTSVHRSLVCRTISCYESCSWLLKIVKCNKYRFLKSSHSQVRVYTDLHRGFNLFRQMILLKMHFTSNSKPRIFFTTKFSKPPFHPSSYPPLYTHTFQQAWEWNLQACKYLTYIYHMLISPRKEPGNTPSTMHLASWGRNAHISNEQRHLGFHNTEVAQAGPAGEQDAGPGKARPWELGGAVLGWFPAGCATATRIRKSCITFCRENRNGRI